MLDRKSIIHRIEAYAAAADLKPSTVCQYAIVNGRFYRHIKNGGDYQAGTVDRLIRWMDENPPEKRGAA